MKTDVLVVGSGIAGLVCALELCRAGKHVLILERGTRAQYGGLAQQAFGGMALMDTPEQKRSRIPDSADRGFEDWCRFGELSEQDVWPRAWAQRYCEYARRDIYDYVRELGLSYLPAVNWVERGRFGEGNSVPRYHVLWGTARALTDALKLRLEPYKQSGALNILFEQKAESVLEHAGVITGVQTMNAKGETHAFYADAIVVATGGFTGDLARVRKQTPATRPFPADALNGSHPFCDGTMHDAIVQRGGVFSQADHMWHYAAGIAHPKPEYEHHGLSLIPCKSALWLNHRGERIGPEPLITGFDTNWLCQRVAQQEKSWTWQVLNYRIAKKEFAISGTDFNPSIRDKNFPRLLKEIFLGNTALIERMRRDSQDFVFADDAATLAHKMNALTEHNYIEEAVLSDTFTRWDTMLGTPYENDDQLRRIHHARQWKPDRMRTCKPKSLLHHSDGPLIAIRCRLITRKSLGGILTNLNSQVLRENDEAIDNLFAIGEAAGFGGGGASGKRSLEGTFLSGCILTARQAARTLGVKR